VDVVQTAAVMIAPGAANSFHSPVACGQFHETLRDAGKTLLHGSAILYFPRFRVAVIDRFKRGQCCKRSPCARFIHGSRADLTGRIQPLGTVRERP